MFDEKTFIKKGKKKHVFLERRTNGSSKNEM